MSSYHRRWIPMISRRPPTNTVQASRYVVVDPQTLGRLRTLKLGDVELDLDGYRVIVRGTPAPLPRKEFMVLRQLMENAGQVVTRGARCWTTPGVRIGQHRPAITCRSTSVAFARRSKATLTGPAAFEQSATLAIFSTCPTRSTIPAATYRDEAFVRRVSRWGFADRLARPGSGSACPR